MALPNEIHPFAIAGGGNQYQVANSLRFRSSATAYAYRIASPLGNTTKWTVSLWTKRGKLGSNYSLFGGFTGSAPTQVYFMSSTADTLRWYDNGGDYQTTQLFRDPSAWYHLVFVYDSTQSTATNRMKIYLNGSQITTFSTQTTVSLNAASRWNGYGFCYQAIGTAYDTSANAFGFYDGYIAEFHNIDGQALDVSYFGKNDPTTNQWVPIKPVLPVNSKIYTVPYSSMWSQSGLTSFTASYVNNASVSDNAFHTDSAGVGAYLSLDLGSGVTKDFNKVAWYSAGATSPSGSYDIQYSDDGTNWSSAYTGFSVNAATSTVPATTTWTSVGSHRYWRLYKTTSAVGGAWTSEVRFFETDTTGYGTNGFYLPFNNATSTGTLGIDYKIGSFSTNRCTDGTSSSNIGNATYLSQAFSGGQFGNYATNMCPYYSSGGAGTYTLLIGKDWGSGVTKTITAFKVTASADYGFSSGSSSDVTIKLQGSSDNSTWTDLYTNTQVSNINYNILLVTSGITTTTAYRYHRISLTENSSTGVSHIAVCSAVEFYESGTYDIGNSLVTSSISITSGSTYDVMIDSPTAYNDGGNGRGNYCTLNPLTKLLSGYTLAAGNLDITNPTVGSVGCSGTISVSSGKWYFEVYIGSVPNGTYFGIGANEQYSRYLYMQTGNKYSDSGGSVAYAASFTTGDIISVAFDLDNGNVVFYKNGASQGTAFTGISGTFTPVWVTNGQASTASNYNFGQRPFSYTPPAGYKALNSYNIPNPSLPLV